MTISENELRDVVATTIRSELGNVGITRIVVENDGSDDDLVRIRVIYEDASSKVDPRKASGLVRRLRPALGAVGEHRFPILSFVASGEADGAYAGAA